MYTGEQEFYGCYRRRVTALTHFSASAFSKRRFFVPLIS